MLRTIFADAFRNPSGRICRDESVITQLPARSLGWTLLQPSTAKSRQATSTILEMGFIDTKKDYCLPVYVSTPDLSRNRTSAALELQMYGNGVNQDLATMYCHF